MEALKATFTALIVPSTTPLRGAELPMGSSKLRITRRTWDNLFGTTWETLFSPATSTKLYQAETIYKPASLFTQSIYDNNDIIWNYPSLGFCSGLSTWIASAWASGDWSSTCKMYLYFTYLTIHGYISYISLPELGRRVSLGVTEECVGRVLSDRYSVYRTLGNDQLRRRASHRI